MSVLTEQEYGLENKLPESNLDYLITDLLAMPTPGDGRVKSVMRLEVLDKATCPLCARIHGMILDINDPRVDLWNEVHPGCRGDWAYLTDRMHPQVIESNWQEPPAELVAQYGDLQLMQSIGLGAWKKKHPGSPVAKPTTDSMTDSVISAIKEAEKTIGINAYADKLGISVDVYNEMTYFEKAQYVIKTLT